MDMLFLKTFTSVNFGLSLLFFFFIYLNMDKLTLSYRSISSSPLNMTKSS